MADNPFKKGDRVAIRPGWKKQGARTGIVVVVRQPNLVSVVWDGTKTASTYHVELLEYVEAPPPRVPV